MTAVKDPRRQLQGRLSKEKGKQFEARLDASFAHYRQSGYAVIEKTPEPMRPTKSLGNGKFVAFYEKKAQPDYKGTIKGGRTVCFEAKFTSTDRLEQNRVLETQCDYMDKLTELGARCYVLAGFGSGEVYRIPWPVWAAMKETFGRKYVTEADLTKYRVQRARADVLLLL